MKGQVNVGTVGHIDHGLFSPQVERDIAETEAKILAFWANNPDIKAEYDALIADYEHEFLYGKPNAPILVLTHNDAYTQGLRGRSPLHEIYQLASEPNQFSKPKKKVRKLLLDGTPRAFFDLFK